MPDGLLSFVTSSPNGLLSLVIRTRFCYLIRYNENKIKPRMKNTSKIIINSTKIFLTLLNVIKKGKIRSSKVTVPDPTSFTPLLHFYLILQSLGPRALFGFLSYLSCPVTTPKQLCYSPQKNVSILRYFQKPLCLIFD